jgi:hypothetical protein
MKPEGIRGVIAERGLEGAVIHLAESADAGAAEQGHEANTVLYQLQGKIEQLEDRVAKLEAPKSEVATVTSENGEK